MLLNPQFSDLINLFTTQFVPNSVQYIIFFSPIFLALFLCVIFWELWIDYIRSKNFLSIKSTILELKLPKETFKSPQAMEVFLTALHNTADGTWLAQYWKGETRPWYSLELVSIEGQVKFMIWTEDRRKVNLMSALYSQFPGIEIKEVEDYSRSVHFDPKILKIWADEFKLAKKDDEPYPLKSYVDYGLESDPKEEFKVDPLLPLIEWLGSVGPNQQVWIQIPIIAHKKDQLKPGSFFERADVWRESVESFKNKIMVRDPETKTSAGEPDPETGYTRLPILSKGEQEVVAALERRMTKFAFDVGIRAIYIAKKDIFNTPFGIGGIIGSFKQFGSEGFNAFKPSGKWLNQFDYPWLDYKNLRKNRQSRLVLMAYRRRSYFYTPFKSKSMVMTTEELATIYHFPGSVAATPTLERVPSKKAEAPTNLPI